MSRSYTPQRTKTKFFKLKMIDQRVADRQEELRQFSAIAAAEDDMGRSPSPVYDCNGHTLFK